MFKERFVVGGELFFAPSIILGHDYHQFSDYGSSLADYHRYYTFGAHYSYQVVLQHLNIAVDEYVLLPSYLCPSMIMPFREAGVKYDFYKMKEGLLPDLEDIEKKTNPGLKAVLFVDYFGVSQKEYLAYTVSNLRIKKVIVIQDTVQSWLNNELDLYGDYCFNSVRKYAPFEASVLFSKDEIAIKSGTWPISKFLIHKRYAQLLRYCHIRYGIMEATTFLRHIDISNESYHHNTVVGMPNLNKCLLDKIDFETMGHQRKTVYRALDAALKPKHVLSGDIGNAVPLGMAVYLENRDAKKSQLHALDIHCPLHWRLSEEIDKKEHEYSWDLEQHELTLPVNVSINNLAPYINRIKEVLG